ncbi:MAG: hypothetical protein OPY06_05050 [Nitrosopumilus sp.]|nr:hypothetical protein [Nitrosopumilus sp.]MDF2426043.1 hypothetical protein [Nitrosopumilus sp.]MDF2428406.1 hypothetical protein [Nitrosopumilus sp.]MDF2429878.1 hypothetical protein [Nitrosopumilus sp.]
MENKQPEKVSVSLQILLYLFFPVMIYLGHKVGKTPFYILIVLITTAGSIILQIGLGYLGIPYYLSILICYGFYLYFARKLIKELKLS